MPEAEADPRIARTRAVVLDAATKLLSEQGSSGFTVDAVVARSGVAKTTIYRHWPCKEDLFMAAVACFGHEGEAPDTGSLRGDLVSLLSGLGSELGTEEWSKSLPAVLDRAEHDPEVAARHLAIVHQRSDSARRLLQRAQERGEIRADVEVELLMSVFAGPLFYRRLMVREATSASQVEAIVDWVLDGVSGAADAGVLEPPSQMTPSPVDHHDEQRPTAPVL